MGNKAVKKVVCKLSYVYKGWLEFRHHGELRESGTYGNANGVDTITLTNKGPSSENQYLADRTGRVKIHTIQHEKAPKASASCHYEFDGNA